ncbi:uncharacterized protein [Chamaea fasciata]|uniref:uncharacterized protein isoform X8 n=1 Tax=Chamaea fasciata TaxID=190680 RepID=UPI003369D313
MPRRTTFRYSWKEEGHRAHWIYPTLSPERSPTTGLQGPCFDNDRQMEKNITTVMCQLNWGTKMCISSNAILTVMGKKLSSWLDSMKGSCGRSTEAADAWRIQSGNGGAVEMLSSDAVSTFCCLSLPTYYCQDGCVVAGGEVKEPCPQTQTYIYLIENKGQGRKLHCEPMQKTTKRV